MRPGSAPTLFFVTGSLMIAPSTLMPSQGAGRHYASAVPLAAQSVPAATQPDPDPKRFDKEIAAFEAEDRARPPAADSILFVGSSSIRYWDIGDAFPGLQTIKRGFGGSHVSDNIYYADRIIFRYHPKLIVFYAGDADVAAGKTADQIFADYRKLIDLIHANSPRTPVVIIGTKPSPAHWNRMDVIRKANAMISESIASDSLVAYADVEKALLGPDGKPVPDFYVENGLNLSAPGYKQWTDAVKPVIERVLKTAR